MIYFEGIVKWVTLPLRAGFDAAPGVLKKPSFAGDTLLTVTANTRLTAKVTKPTRKLRVFLSVVTQRAGFHTGAVWETRHRVKMSFSSLNVYSQRHSDSLSRRCGGLQLRQWSLLGPEQFWQRAWHCRHSPFWSRYEPGEH